MSGNSVVPGFPNMISTPSCLSRSRKARLPDMTGKTFSQDWGSVVVHRDAAAPPTSAVDQQPRLRSHIIERRWVASEGWREQEGRGFRRRGQDAKRAPGEGSISRLDQKNYATPKPIVAKITRLIE